MKEIVRDKFTRGRHLGLWLKAAGNAYLEETNRWGDDYWGVSGGVGANNLGIIRMETRLRLRYMT